MKKIICVWICLVVGSVAGCNLRLGTWAGSWERIEYVDPEPDTEVGTTSIDPIEILPDEESIPIQEPIEPIETSEQAVHAEIETAGKLESMWSRRQVYLQLASRRGLSDPCQQHLVNALLDNLLSESAKEEVLLQLIRNPDFSKGTRKLILQRLNNFNTASRKQRIASALAH
ncbi:MAG: hypothetical protein JXA82_09200 [Sedimentisphaerales bacterium]|nr:hypothetical protein [Sedimentisphaerales bacterium]